MQDVDIERPTNAPSATILSTETASATRAPTEPQASLSPKATGPTPQKPHPWVLILSLTGLLGAVWAVAIISRYQHILPG